MASSEHAASQDFRLTPLIRAIDYGEPDVVAKLLDIGADPNLRGDVDDQTPLYLCIRNMGGQRAAQSIRTMMLKSLSGNRDGMQREALRRYGVSVAGVFGDKQSMFDAMRKRTPRRSSERCNMRE